MKCKKCGRETKVAETECIKCHSRYTINDVLKELDEAYQQEARLMAVINRYKYVVETIKDMLI